MHTTAWKIYPVQPVLARCALNRSQSTGRLFKRIFTKAVFLPRSFVWGPPTYHRLEPLSAPFPFMNLWEFIAEPGNQLCLLLFRRFWRSVSWEQASEGRKSDQWDLLYLYRTRWLERSPWVLRICRWHDFKYGNFECHSSRCKFLIVKEFKR